MTGFDPKTATEGEILLRADGLKGRLVGSLENLVQGKGSKGKGDVGLTVERFFGIAQNSLSAPDFPSAGIELKVVPLVRRAKGLRVKERTVISMIDYNALVLEKWANAHVRIKLHVLFVYYEFLPGVDKGLLPIRLFTLWTPDQATNALLRADWTRVRAKVRHGLATELTESDGRVLGPCTKGTNSKSVRSQPFSPLPAKSRAFALKPAFTLGIFRMVAGTSGNVESLTKNIGLKGFDHFETDLVARFDKYVGQKVSNVAKRLRVPPTDAKSEAARVVRRIFGAKDFRSKILEFEETGLTLRISRVSPSLEPYESLSFPFLRYAELLEEEWVDSDLLSRVEYMLLIPVVGKTRETPQSQCMLGPPVFWRPDSAQI
jgi:DNA mismatch repair protein MutH